ncbi:DUF7341 domain-containing protein [Nocardia rhizosphaerae]|uniref:Uncharacterized protein n=1 Tax=Nocardia rhizosphaerae TaxID=1691571 RepID=A0ABV8LDA8_9NOCA
MSDELVAGARAALADAVHALVGMQVEHVEQNGRQVPIPIDSLYDQLCEASLGERQDGGSVRRPEPGSRAPGWSDALSLLELIDRRVGEWSIGAAEVPGRAVTARRLYALADTAWAPEDVAYVRRLAAQVDSWAVRVRRLLDEEREWELKAPCPSCGEMVIAGQDGSGETVRQYVLRANLSGAECLSCGMQWAPEYYRLLGALIGAPTPEGILE